MDNDNKISESAENEVQDITIDESEEAKEVSLFLKEELFPLKKKKAVTVYDLEKEYAKTRKNKNYGLWVVLFLTVVGVVLSTWLIIREVNAKADQVEVNLEAFEDLNLRNLFDAMSKTQDLYEQASKVKSELQASLEQKIQAARRSRDADLDYIKRMNLNRKARQDRESVVIKKFNQAVNAAHLEFDEKIKAADIELKQYEEQIKSYDSENVEKAQAWENEMDSQRQIHEIEKGRITDDYEKKLDDLKTQMQENQEKSWQERRLAINELTTYYDNLVSKLDPVIRDNNVKNIIANSSGYAPDKFVPDSINQSVTYTDEEYTQELNAVKKKYDEYMALTKITSGIPYNNGLDGLLKTERQITYEMAYTIANAGASKISKLKADNLQLTTQLDNYKADNDKLRNSLSQSNVLLDAYAKSIKVDGFVLNVNSITEVTVFVSSSARNNVKNDGSSKAVILDADNQTVASGSLWFKNSVYYLTLDEEVEGILPGSIIKIGK